MTKWVEQQICIKFFIKLECSSVETIWMIQKSAAMGNLWLAASSSQCAAHASSLIHSFLAKHQITQVTQHCPLQPRFGALRFLAFPKTEITFEREEITDHWWDSGKYDGTAGGDWENCVRSQSAYVEGDWGIIVLRTIFPVSCIFFNKCLYFSYYTAAYLLDRPYIIELW